LGSTALVGVAALSASAQAQETWNGGTGAWGTATSWTPNTVPNAVDATATFNVVAGVFSGVDLGGSSYTIGTLNLDGAQNLAGYSFRSGTLIMRVSAGQAQINVQTNAFLPDFGFFSAVTLQLNSATTINTTAGATIGFASDAQITGAGALTFSGSGTATLAGANNYTGGTTLSGGTLDITGAGTLGTTSNALTVSGGTLDLGTTTQTQDGGLTLTGGTIQNGTLSSASTFGLEAGTVSAVLSGTGAVDKTTAGTVFLSNANNYSGGTTISGGTLSISNGSALSSGPVTFAGNAVTGPTLESKATTGPNLTNDITINAGSSATIEVASGQGLVLVSGSFAYNGGSSTTLHFNSAGDQGQLSLDPTAATADSNGSISIDGGFVYLQSPAAATLVGLLQGGATVGTSVVPAKLDLAGNSATLYNLSGNAEGDIRSTSSAATLTVDSVVNSTYAGLLEDGTGLSLIKTGAATLTITGNSLVGNTVPEPNTYSGGTTIAAGEISIGATTALGTGTVTFNGGSGGSTLESTATGTLGNSITINVGSSATIETTSSQTLTLGAGGIVADGGVGTTLHFGSSTDTGTLVLASGVVGVDSTGAVAIDGGTLQLGSVSGAFLVNNLRAGMTVGSGATTATLDIDGRATTPWNLTGTSAGVITNSGAAATLTTDNTANSTFSGVIQDGAGTIALHVTGTSGEALTLTGANTYSGATTIDSGLTLMGGMAGAFSAISATTVNGTLDLGGFAQTINTVDLAGGTIQNGSLTGAITSTGGSVSDLGGGASLTNTSGTTTLSGANSYSGATTINGGNLSAGAINAFSAASAVTVNGTGKLSLSGFDNAIASLSGDGSVVNGAGLAETLTLAAATGTTTFSGAISNGADGALNLAKTGGSTQILSGTNTYTGSTTVSGGVLEVDGSLASPTVSVTNGGTLAGTGTLAGAVTIGNGGKLSPGDAPGTIHVGPLTLNSNSILAYQLGTPNVVGGPTNDLTVVNGALNINGGALFVSNSGGFGVGLYQIIDYTGALGGNGQLTIGSLPNGDTGVIQTTIPGEINLIVSGPSALTQFWDGATTTGDGTVHGGSGTWNNTATNWTTPNGAINASWQGALAVFEGTAGTVTVGAPISYQGLQFSTTGYVVTATGGGSLNPTGVAPIIVDGGLTATIAAPIVGSGGVQKTGLGTLMLTGADTYSGGTTITAGTLALSGAGSIASSSGVVDNATFDISGTNAGASIATLSGSGTVALGVQTLTLTNQSSTFSGAIGGSGGLTLSGAGTETLSGANGYTGATTISAGTLALSGAGSIASSSAVVIPTGGTFDISQTTAGASITTLAFFIGSGTSGAVMLGSKTLTITNGSTEFGGVIADGGIGGGTGGNLTIAGGTEVLFGGPNAYTGRTTIAPAGGATSAVLALGGSGSIATSSGVFIATSGTFDISRTYAGASITTLADYPSSPAGGTVSLGLQTLTITNGSTTFSGVIADGGIGGEIGAGGGNLTIAGGTQTLAGVNTYTGQTTISAGTLALSGAGSIASSSGVVDNATFDISGTNAGASIATLSGSGTVTLGAQMLTLTNQSSTFSGMIGGTGGLTLTGAGTETLTGANTYTGGTRLDAGTLAVGDSAALGTGPLTMQDGTVLQFSASGLNLANAIIFPGVDPTIDTGANNDTISGVISGTGGLTKIGSGSLDLTATSTYTGATIISAGTLVVDGSIASSSSLTIAAGTTLAGSGVVPHFVVPSGATVAPGALTPFSTLHVAGALGFLSGSAYTVNINPVGANDKIVATGAATLSGGTVNVVAASGSYSTANRYTILTAGGGVTGAFASLTTTTNLAFLSPTLSYDANDAYLGFAQTAAFPSVAVTPNQAATATAIQALGAGTPIYNAVVGQSVEGARQAFDALSGEIHASAVSAAFDDSRLPREAVLDRLSSPYGTLPSGGAAGFAAMNAIAGPSVPANVFAGWGQAFGSFGHIGGDGNAATVDRSTGGFILGLDATLDARYRLGVAAGYTESSLSIAARGSSGSVQSTYAGLYGGASLNALQLRGGAFYAFNHYSTNRSVAFPGFSDADSAGYGGDTLQAFGEAGWRVPVSGFAGPTFVEPIAALTAMHIETDAYTESGGAAALTGASQGYDYAATTLGVRAEAALFSNVPLTARGMIGWRHVFGDVTPDSTLAFASAPSIPFTIAGAPVARNALAIEAGFDWKLTNNATVGVFYSGSLGNRDQDNAIKGKLEAAF
jgi:fibronectin-binding autotransporter adhesin